MKNIAFFFSLMLTVLLLTPQNTVSQDNPPHPRMWNDLSLTDDQKNKLMKMHNEMQSIRKKNMEEQRALRMKIKEELTKDTPSKATLSNYAKELGKLHNAQIENNIEHLIQLKTILNKEQFQTIIDKQWDKRSKGRPHKQAGCNHGEMKVKPGCHDKNRMGDNDENKRDDSCNHSSQM